MFIKRLLISTPNKVIRDIEFKLGLNFIIDNTPIEKIKATGNNVGKTTVLKLVDFCLGKDAKALYTDTEDKKKVYDEVKDYLIKNKVEISLTLVSDMESSNQDTFTICRNFVTGAKGLLTINGETIPKGTFDTKLLSLFMPQHDAEKPTFRQIISHNIRYEDLSINNTLKTLNTFTTKAEYEALYLYLLGYTYNMGGQKQELSARLKQEKNYKFKIEKKGKKIDYELALELLNSEILEINHKKSTLNLNEDFDTDLKELNEIKFKLNQSASIITQLQVRQNIIQEAKSELESEKSIVNVEQLQQLYDETSNYISNLNKKFGELVQYHNKMINERMQFITEELPALALKIEKEQKIIDTFLIKEKKLSQKIAKSDSFEELEQIITRLNEKYQSKGEYETIIVQINEVEETIKDLEQDITRINDSLHSEHAKTKVTEQIKKFNVFFSSVSDELYGEKYALTYYLVTDKNNQTYYEFSAFNANMSSGKKQGEILCFDIAYTLFADSENIPCFHFLLNDKKELLHNNQLQGVANFIKNKKIQLIMSITRGKFPEKTLNNAHIALELSEDDKLFRIEN